MPHCEVENCCNEQPLVPGSRFCPTRFVTRLNQGRHYAELRKDDLRCLIRGCEEPAEGERARFCAGHERVLGVDKYLYPHDVMYFLATFAEPGEMALLLQTAPPVESNRKAVEEHMRDVAKLVAERR